MSQFIVGLERAITIAKAPPSKTLAMQLPKEWTDPLSPEEKDGLLKLAQHCFDLGRTQVAADIADEIRKTRGG